MKTAQEWMKEFPTDRIAWDDLEQLILRIQIDSLRHAESIARWIYTQHSRDEGFRICRGLEQEAIKLQNEFAARNDSQTK